VTDELDALLDEAKPPQRMVDICLRPDLIDEYKRLKSELADETEGSLAGGGSNDALKALEERIRKATTTFTMRALPRKKYRALVNEHRSKGEKDRAAGMDTDAFMSAVLRASVVSPAMTDARWERLESVLSTGQWEKLHANAHVVNSTEADVPF